MTLEELARKNRETARNFSAPQPSPLEERIRRALKSVLGREPSDGEIRREVELSISLAAKMSA